MKLFKEGLVRIDCGSAFHNFEAEYEKERSYNAVDLAHHKIFHAKVCKGGIIYNIAPLKGVLHVHHLIDRYKKTMA